MKKIALLCLAFAFPLFAEDAPKSLPIAAAPVELARVDANADAATKLAQYEKAVAIIIRQRTEADAQVRDWQVQCALLQAENEALKKQLGDAQAKLAVAVNPGGKAESIPADKNLKTETKLLSKSP